MVPLLDTMIAENGVAGAYAPGTRGVAHAGRADHLGRPGRPGHVGRPGVPGTEELLADSLDSVDAQIVALVRRRTALSAALRELGRTGGRPAVGLAHENRVIRRYGHEFGPHGSSLGHLLVRMATVRTG
ncbi:hypothetical protein [Streptomyces sp. NPDC090025]|uniref:hypothetical protein n=1 Tax=Streptomyces sp. NPDC090025 TaxID=3365922 RepID=UPI003839421F